MADGKINWYTDVVIKLSKPCCLRWTSRAKLFKVSIRAKLFKVSMRAKLFKVSIRAKLFKVSIRAKLFKVNIKARLFKVIMLQSLPTEGVCTNIGRTGGGRYFRAYSLFVDL